jgi:hypothetical protein
MRREGAGVDVARAAQGPLSLNRIKDMHQRKQVEELHDKASRRRAKCGNSWGAGMQ